MHPRVNSNAKATRTGFGATEGRLMSQSLIATVIHAAPIPAPGYQ